MDLVWLILPLQATSTIARLPAEKGVASFTDYTRIHTAPEKGALGITANPTHTEHESDSRHSGHIDCHGRTDCEYRF